MPVSTHFLLVTLGSAGDVYPFMGLGLALQQRGYRTTLITNPHFEPAARQAGLDFIPWGKTAFYETLITHPDIWHPRKGPRLLAEKGLPLTIRPLYDILHAFDPAQTVVVGSSAAIGARLMQERFGMPLVTVYLQPAYLFSLYQTAKISGLTWLDKAPRPIKRWVGQQISKQIDRVMCPAIDAFRAEIGLRPLTNGMAWSNSPQRIIGLFPEWFGPLQPDWPPQIRLTGFPLYDGPGTTTQKISDDLENFLKGGSAPVVYTLGTATRQSRQFFAESIEVCHLLGRRAILMTQYRDQLPEILPETVFHATYIPFGTLLRHAAGLVYSGGIGTLAQALSAGIPHLLVPMAHDQPDNAARIERLGVGMSIPLKDYRAARVANKLELLLTSNAVRERCHLYAKKLKADETIQATCSLIEALIPG